MICETRGINFLPVVQPVLHDKKFRTSLEQELLDQDMVNFPEFLEVYNEIQRMSKGFNALDMATIYNRDKHHIFLDSCHVTDDGYEMMAALIAQRFDAPAAAAFGR